MRAPLDLRADSSLADLVVTAAELLNTTVNGDVTVGGDDGATCGIRTTRGTWVRLQHRRLDDEPPGWDAEEHAATLTGIRKPSWYQAVTFFDVDRDVEWRADELQLVTSSVLGESNGRPTRGERLSDEWWQVLRQQLTVLADQRTDRVALDQDELTRRIIREFGELDTTVDDWATAHGDLTWANVTDDATLLDWEGWGRGPRGLDAATLWGLALPYPSLAEQVQHAFADVFATRTGRLVQLLWCAAALRPVSTRTDLADYRDPVHAAAQELVRTLY